jgi:NADH:ubiquinone oxidoreductase subunit 3 (subunit A)/uncharacterized protein YukE
MSSQFQSLSNSFNSLLTEYTNTYKIYINAINSNDNSLTTVNDALFTGTSNLNVINNSNANSCLTSCSSNTSCGGATFNDINNTCTLSSGKGSIAYAINSKAFVKKILGYSYKLQQLNNQLTNINNQMKNLSKSNYAEYDKNNQTSKSQDEILKTNYETLVQEKSEIEEMIKKYETVNTSYEDGSVNVTSNYYIYIIFLFIVIFLIIFLLTYSFKSSTEQRGGGKYFNFNTILYLIFLGIVVVFNASIKK